MITVSFSVPDNKIERIKDAMSGLYPIPRDAAGDALFSGGAWAKEAIRKLVIREVSRWEKKQSVAIAIGSVIEDDELLS